MATGLDEDYKKPKNLTDQIIRLLDDDAITPPDRLRLIVQYILYRDGVFNTDIDKLLAHAQLHPREGEIIQNLDVLGARITRQVKDQKPPSQPLFPRKQAPLATQEDLSLSRFDPIVKSMLEEQLKGTLDQTIFPYTRPLLDANEALAGQINMSQSSLRSAKPTWARTRPSAMEPRQRIIVFMAGGATYSESRACYEISRTFSKDVYMATSHMLTPNLFLRQVGDLSTDRRQLGLPADRPPPKAPAHIYERELPPPPAQPQPPTSSLAAMTVNSNGSAQPNLNGSASHQQNSQRPSSSSTKNGSSSSKLHKEHKEKKRGFFKF